MKPILRAFSLGLFIATLLLAISYVYDDTQDPEIIEKRLTTEEKIAELENEGYFIYDYNPYESINDTKEQAIEETDDQDEVANGANDDQVGNEHDENTYTLVINPGMTVSQVAEYLVAAGIIDHRNQLTDYLTEHRFGNNIQVGSFELDRGMDLEDVVQLIANPE